MKRASRHSVRRRAFFAMFALALTLALALVAEDAPANVVSRGTTAVAVASVPPPNFLLKWGGQGTGNGQFDDPRGLAVDITGDVYVVDMGNDRVQKFDPEGRYLTQWGSAGPIPDSADGHFSAPMDVAVYRGDADRSTQFVYVADTLNSRVQKFLPNGTFVEKWGKWGSGQGEFRQPRGIAVGPSGNVYVVDGLNGRIQKFSSDGGYIAQWGAHVDKGGQFRSLQGIAVDSQENVYVADSGVYAVLKFTAGGQPLGKWTTFGSGDPPQLAPFDVAVDARDNVYVCEGARVTVFSSAGTPLGQWGLRTDAGINAPSGTGIAVAPTGEVYVSDGNFDCVKKYDIKGAMDETPPKTTVRGADDAWHKQPVTLAFTATDEPGGSGVDYIEVRFQDWLLPVWGPWLRAFEPGKESELIVPASSDHSDDGEHLIEYRSVDLAGNVEKAKQVKVLIDTGKPQVTLRPTATAQPGEVLITATASKKAVVKFTVQDRLSPEIRYVGYVLDRRGVRAVRSAASGWLPLEGVHSWRFMCRLKPGTYRIEIRAVDRAENVGVSEAAFVVKRAVSAAK
jgi:DNA-binding beta-propeller fold protein YncE